jgi:hypothetical protein
MQDSFTGYYRCPQEYATFAVSQQLPPDSGYFRIGNEIAYGQCSGATPSSSVGAALPDVSAYIASERGQIVLPFDIDSIINNLRVEEYPSARTSRLASTRLLHDLYYGLRPLLPFQLRRRLQQAYLRNWQQISFPRWPVDCAVDKIFSGLMALAVQRTPQKEIPFIWFWPEGASACAVLTHDVENSAGRDFCSALMDLDESFAFKASFQFVPEVRYSLSDSLLQSVRMRGFEVCVQDLNHDGQLYRNEPQFRSRARKINAYGKAWQARGFRSAVLYRRQEWFDALDFDFDMSVPNVASLDPQRGGCCTVMPYFIGNILELPVTTTQDYSLFNVLGAHSIELWTQQIHTIMEQHGLISFIIHPDYIQGDEEQRTIKQLLTYLSRARAECNLWTPTPGEVAKWWRQRSKMNIVEESGMLRVRGEGSERARIAYASIEGGRVVYRAIQSSAAGSASL